MRNAITKTLALLMVLSGYMAAGHSLAAQASAKNAGDEPVFLSPDGGLLSNNELAGTRGAAAINTLTSTQTLAASTSGNTLDVGGDLTNGEILIGQNFGGFGSYVMNTGNNSTINSAVSLNIQIMPSP